MTTDLNREQIMMIVERARNQRSIATGDLYAAITHQSLGWLARGIDKFLHLLLMSPMAHR
ncbi:hypothetical protein [Candidatus Accumulibacter vicinus]|uniref:Uncharacterized protein n=1 Tax=Candidatus Accumulibacter vicinus TaxID=2954382 RepID=A0A084Y475_9PROT|nr:hypothetical protein [Candidatus Accumulibacter vicinus]KFB69519.1 MAG: hypothetical protein CAPSK01_000782 [Candidatus Accumulibacter vicinus]